MVVGSVKAFPSLKLSWSERTNSHIGTEKGPDFLGRQQWGILNNGLTLDSAMPLEGQSRYQDIRN